MSSLPKSGKITRENVMSLSGIFPAFYYDLDRTCFQSFPLKFPLTTKSVLLPHRFLRHFQSCQTQPGFIFGNRHKMIIVLLDHINKELACF